MAPKAVGFAMLARFFYVGLSSYDGTFGTPLAGQWPELLAIVSACTMTLGNLTAIWQNNLKRLLAYSSIAHAGYMMMGVVMLSSAGLQGVMFYAVERLGSCGREGFVTSIKLADTDGNTVPRDGRTPGEILVRSEANMVGYWQREDLTGQIVRDGWMWTGDIATWDEDGYIFIVDRAKDMIISGGENIYSTQVEAAIHQHPAVLESAVFGIPDTQWGESVKAVVVLKPGEKATEAEIIATAGEHLASYQKPKSVDFVDSLPKAPTGKILKRELRDPYWQNREKNV